jgi:soluble lytic murein transglycosylase
VTVAALGRVIGVPLRRVRRPTLIAGVLALALAGWFAVHVSMPGWYARWWYPLDHAASITGEAAATGLDADLIAAVIYRESKFSPSARSEQGAVGLMQVLPATASWIHRQPGAPSAMPDRLAEPSVNIAYGAWYLRYLQGKYGGVELALVAYNGGETNLRQWMEAARRDGTTFTVSQVPFSETRGFVASVDHARDIYRRAWGGELGVSR